MDQLEFVPLAELGSPNPTRHWLANVETGIEYALAVSSNAGLWSYIVGDTVKFVSRDPPRLLVTGRTSYYLSAFGEHLTGSEVEDSVSAATAAIGARVSDFSVGAIYPDGGRSRGGHLFIVEFGDSAPSPEGAIRFLAALDESLSRLNDDYRGHRAGGFGLDPPRLLAVSRGTDWFRRNVITSVPWPSIGFGRKVYPGFMQLSGFMTMNLDRHLDAHRELFWHLVEGDGDSAEKHREFYDEYMSVMDLTAEFYLQTIQVVFKEHQLPRGVWVSRGRPIEPAAIETALMPFSISSLASSVDLRERSACDQVCEPTVWPPSITCLRISG